VTAENVRGHLPSTEDLGRVEEYFSRLGFTVEHAFANSFAITGPAELFEKVFDAGLLETEKGGLKASHSDQSGSFELPKDRLPTEIGKIVSAITFSPPPDFGPKSF